MLFTKTYPYQVARSAPIAYMEHFRLPYLPYLAKKDEVLSIGESAGYKTKVRDMIETREKGALRCKVEKDEHLKIYGGLKEGIGMEAYLHGPLDAAKSVKLRFRVGDLDLPERRKRLPAIVDRAVWKKGTKGQTGIRRIKKSRKNRKG